MDVKSIISKLLKVPNLDDIEVELQGSDGSEHESDDEDEE